MAHDVFISYSSEDQTIVEALSHYLEENGVRCFVAYRDIHKGKSWAKAIAEAIEQCQMMVVVFSDSFNRSEQVDREIELCCDEEKKPVLTFKITNTKFSGAKKFFLKNLNWIDAFPCPEDNFRSLLDNISKLIVLSDAPKTHTPQTTTPLPEVNVATENFICHIGRKVTREMIAQAVEIDKQVYNDDFQGILETCLGWWKKNPEIYVMLEDTETRKIVGYINAMALDEAYCEEIISGTIVDTTIPIEYINNYDFPDVYKLYFASIAIHPDYHNTSAFKLLYDAFLLHIMRLADREIYFSEVLADAVSDSGEKLCKYIGMQQLKESSHGSKIYTTSLLPPKIRITTKVSRQLTEKYEAIFRQQNTPAI